MYYSNFANCLLFSRCEWDNCWVSLSSKWPSKKSVFDDVKQEKSIKQFELSPIMGGIMMGTGMGFAIGLATHITVGLTMAVVMSVVWMLVFQANKNKQ